MLANFLKKAMIPTRQCGFLQIDSKYFHFEYSKEGKGNLNLPYVSSIFLEKSEHDNFMKNTIKITPEVKLLNKSTGVLSNNITKDVYKVKSIFKSNKPQLDKKNTNTAIKTAKTLEKNLSVLTTDTTPTKLKVENSITKFSGNSLYTKYNINFLPESKLYIGLKPIIKKFSDKSYIFNLNFSGKNLSIVQRKGLFTKFTINLLPENKLHTGLKPIIKKFSDKSYIFNLKFSGKNLYTKHNSIKSNLSSEFNIIQELNNIIYFNVHDKNNGIGIKNNNQNMGSIEDDIKDIQSIMYQIDKHDTNFTNLVNLPETVLIA